MHDTSEGIIHPIVTCLLTWDWCQVIVRYIQWNLLPVTGCSFDMGCLNVPYRYLLRSVNDVLIYGYANRRSLAIFLSYISYIKGYYNPGLSFDPTYPEFEYGKFEKKDWSKFTNIWKSNFSSEILDPLRKVFIIRVLVDSN